MKGKSALLSMFALAFAGMGSSYPSTATGSTMRELDIDELRRKKVKEVIPAGCDKYTFYKDGIPLKEGGVIEFTCIAMNEKSAIKKYNKWKLQLK